MTPDFDLIIVGAGLSGIGAACHVERECPGTRYAILEARNALGGTWDLFRYPGIRSDSDMHTLGYNFKPWTDAKAIADGPAILRYIKDTAEEFDVRKYVQLNSKVTALDWSDTDQMWTLDISDGAGNTRQMSARFVQLCAGYYDMENGYRPEFEGEADFDGEIIHPQHWPEGLDYAGKNVVVIGSGATAVTLIPELAKQAAHVTMLQRSPTWIAARPDTDMIANALRKILPEKTAYNVTRAKNIAYTRYIYNKSQKSPKGVGDYMKKQIRKALGEDYPVETHFNPSYNPWDQRLCLAPNGDLFAAIKSGKAAVVTDHIARFTKTGIETKSGEHLDADIIVTATGLNISFMGGATLRVNGQEMAANQRFGYKGLMFSDIPNLVSVFGYTNASWTMRADLISQYTCRLLNHMKDNQYHQVTPRAPEDLQPRPWIDFGAGYLQRVMDDIPRSGDRYPWLNKQDYKFDLKSLGQDGFEGDGLEFRTAQMEAAA